MCAAMLSACVTKEDTAQAENTSNAETTASAEETSETSDANKADQKSTTEEAEPEPEINYQKKRVVTYPAEGSSYVSIEYEYGDNDYYKETNYLNDGTVTSYIEYEYGDDGYSKVTERIIDLLICTEYKNNIKIKETECNAVDLAAGRIKEYDESELNYVIKSSYFDNREQEVFSDNYKEYKSTESTHDYKFNDDFTEAVVTITTTSAFKNLDEIDEVVVTYIQKYEYDELGRVIHEWGYYTHSSEDIFGEYYYTYDNNGNRLITMDGILSKTYEYDEHGNMIMEKNDYSTKTYEYDDNNNLIHYNYSSDKSSSDTYYDYDEYGRQIGWTEYDEDGNETSHSVVEYE